MEHHGVSRSISQLSLASGTSEVSAPFEYHRAVRKTMKRRAVAVIGTSSSESVRGAPEPRRDLFVYRVLDGNIEDCITEHKIEVRNLEQISKDGFMSFKVTVKVSDRNTLLQAEFWPVGVCVRRYYAPRYRENTYDG